MIDRSRVIAVVATVVSCVASVSTPACAGLTTEQQEAVMKVQVQIAEPAADCQNLGVVSGSRDSTERSGLRGRVVLLGGNTVRVDARGGSDGTAFYCPAPKPAPEVEPVP